MTPLIYIQRERIEHEPMDLWDAIDALFTGDEDIAEALGYPGATQRRELGNLCGDVDEIAIRCQQLREPHEKAIAKLQADYERELAKLAAKARDLLPHANWEDEA